MNKHNRINDRILIYIKKTKRHTVLYSVISIVLFSALLFVLPVWSNYNDSFLNHSHSHMRDENHSFVASFVGDINFSMSNGQDISKSLSDDKVGEFIAPYLSLSDYVSGNANSKITADSASLLKKLNFSSISFSGASFRNPETLSTIHSLDVLDTHDITGTGAIVDKQPSEVISFQEINGIKIAELSFSETELVQYIPYIDEAKAKADLLIIHISWGDLYSTKISDTQRNMAHAISNAGADIIIGHNTNVLQPIELYNNTIILYNLGNFLGSGGYSVTKESAVVQYIQQDDGTSFLDIFPIKIVSFEPKPALGILDYFKRQNIFRILTRELSTDESWNINENVLQITLP